MKHFTFQGNHRRIGAEWGSSLAARKIKISEHIPFSLTRERLLFAKQCLPVYQELFPEILEEIEGFAQGQGCDPSLLETLLFSMYAMPPACRCSCFAVSGKNQVLLGRNSDFLTAREEDYGNVLYQFPQETPSLSFCGNTTSFIQMEDGINEAGLAIGMTSVAPTAIQPGFNAGLLLRFLLEKCSTVENAVSWLGCVPIASAQILVLADLHGAIAQVECDSLGMVVERPQAEKIYVCGTNLFHLPGMRRTSPPAADFWRAEERYKTMKAYLEASALDMDVEAAKSLLSGEQGFLCQYDRTTGQDTVWSVIYDLSGKQVLRAEGNPSRCEYQLDRRLRF